MKAHHKENTIYTTILIIVLGIIAIFAVSASKTLDGINPTRVGNWSLLPQVINAPLAKLGITEKELAPCLENPETKQIIARDAEEAGTTGTPLFYIFSNNYAYRMIGAIPSAMLSQMIDSLQAGNPIAAPTGGPEGSFQELTADAPEMAYLALRPTDARLNATISNPSVTIIEYGDLSCPACKYAHQELKKALSKETTVQYVYRHHPLTTLHPDAQQQAEVAVCVQQLKGYKAFWDFVDLSYRQ